MIIPYADPQFRQFQENSLPDWAKLTIYANIREGDFEEMCDYWAKNKLFQVTHNMDNLAIEKQIELEEYFHKTIFKHFNQSRKITGLNSQMSSSSNIYFWVHQFRQTLDILATCHYPGRLFMNKNQEEESLYTFFDIRTYIYEIVDNKRYYQLNTRVIYNLLCQMGHQTELNPVKLLYFKNNIAFTKNLDKPHEGRFGGHTINLEEKEIDRLLKPELDHNELDICSS